MQISWQQRTMQISWSFLCCTILQAAYYVDIFVITLLHNIVGSVLCRYLGHYFAAQYCRQRTMQISWSLLCCTILQAAYYVVILVITLLHNTVGSVLCRYLGHNYAAQYCRLHTMQIFAVTLLHNIVGSVLCRYLGHYFAAQSCRQRTRQISWSLLCYTILQQRTMQISWSLICCTIRQVAYYVDILVVSLLHNIVCSLLCRYFGHYFAAQYCWQRTMQISWSLLCCTILQAAYYVDMLVITLLHNIVSSVLCTYLRRYFAAQYCSCVLFRYLGNYFAAQYCRMRTMQISWSLLCCTILQAVYYIDILVVTLLHNIVGSVLCRYLGHYFAAQYCSQHIMQISQPLLCCTILQAAYQVDILVITLLHNIVGSVLCRYLGHYSATHYCRQRTMQISWSLLCCTIL